jgi:hypothetical protein
MIPPVERAKKLKAFLETNNNPKMEIGLITSAIVDATTEATEAAVRKTREQILSMVEKRMGVATGLVREVLVELNTEIWRLGR